MTPRLATSVLVSALLRQVETEGGFGTVLAKGDAMAGSVVILLTERGKNIMFLERLLQSDGRYSWQDNPQFIESPEELTNYILRRRKNDPDLWVLELDVASAERFAAEINSFG